MAPTPALNISRNLSPGSQGSDVQQLQEWLKAQGYFPSNQPTTTNYGPITTKAVADWQSANNIDTKGNPGYFGPISQSFVAQQVIQQNKAPVTPVVTPVPTPDQTFQSAQKTGITPEQYKTLDANQRAIVALVGETSGALYSSGSTGVSLDEALKTAAKDPNILSKYADALKIDTNTFQQSLDQLRISISSDSQNKQTQFENDRKALAEANAAAGRAYSGFRGKAQEQLVANESGIINSTRSAIKKNVNDLTSAFENKYGTAATPAATADYADPLRSSNITASGLYVPTSQATETFNGNLAGGVKGSSEYEKESDITNKAKSLYDVAQLPKL